MRTEIQWVNNVHFTAEADSGHTVMIDGPPDSGGQNMGSRPMELMLMGVGGCTSFDVVNILVTDHSPKSRHSASGIRVHSHSLFAVGRRPR
jgi:uncharacterized OsmC-like protein